MSFRSGDLFINSVNNNNVVANITLFKAASLDDSSIQSASCSGGKLNVANKTAIVQAITGEASKLPSYIACNSGTETFKWTFSKCGSYLPSLAVTSSLSNRMSIDSCYSECERTAPADGLTLLVVDFVQKKPAPSIQSISFTSSKSAIVAEVVMTDPGSVYCSAFPLSYVPPSVDLVVMGGNVASSLEDNTTLIVTVSNLQAASNFSLYCVTYSVEGVRMAYDTMTSTKKIVSTLCCKSVIAQLLVNSFTIGTSEQSALRLSLDSPLSTDTTMYLNLTSSSDSKMNRASASYFPKKVVFKAGLAKTVTISFQAAAVGAYNLSFSLSGIKASSEVDIAYPRGQVNTITVVEANQKLPPPQFLSAEFSQTGASLTVKFTAPTNKARLPSSFACSLLLSFTGSSIYSRFIH